MQVGNINPVNLRGLKQALYVMRSLEEGRDKEDVAEIFDGDVQLVEIWTNFLIHNYWIQKLGSDNGVPRYLVTDKGRDWLLRIQNVDAV